MNKCTLKKINSKQPGYPWASHVLVKDRKNKMGIEFIDNVYLRIDGFVFTSESSLFQMLDALVTIARANGEIPLYFADTISADSLDSLIKYGFVEKTCSLDSNHYLYFYIKDGNCNNEKDTF